jgi:uncharacterized protein (DUF2141 family)
MKSYIFVFAFIFVQSTHLSFGQTSIEITVRNIKEPKGSIRVGLFTNENDFLKKPADGKVVKATGTEVKVIFENLKAGEYAFSVFS